jgi:hypothetical protein
MNHEKAPPLKAGRSSEPGELLTPAQLMRIEPCAPRRC